MATATLDKAPESGASSGQLSGTKTTGITGSGMASEALIKAASSAEAGEQSNAGPSAITGQLPKTGTEQPTPTDDKPTTEAQPSGQPPADGKADALPEARAVALTRNARQQLSTHLGQQIGLVDGNGAARAITPADLPDLRAGYSLVRELRNDAAAFFYQLGTELGYQFPDESEPEEVMPTASLTSEDGRAAYSQQDVDKLLEIREKRLMSRFAEQLRPFESMRTTSEEGQAREQARSTAGGILTEARKLPHFKENEPDISAHIRQMTPQQRQQLGATGTLYYAYNQVLAQKVWPSVAQDAEKRVRDENAKKAAGSTIISPTGAHGDAKPPRLDSVDDLSAHMSRMFTAS